MPYERALETTDPRQQKTLSPGSPEEKAALERVFDLFSELTEERIRSKVRDVYAAQAYFHDTLKEVHGVGAIEEYLVDSARAVNHCTVRFTDVGRSEGEYYLRWEMEIEFKKLKRGQVCRSIGMTHMRFDEQGMVVLHQDYWDAASGVFEHVPLLGSMIRAIKNRL
ncbi:MAG: nuclear transport factor 2 family protein [Acidobacteriota bacterium]|nr:MAG: nuclear transport factor 2 family protein [Acidobacteriota bacterium]